MVFSKIGNFINLLNPVNISHKIIAELAKPVNKIGNVINSIGTTVVDGTKKVSNFINNLPSPKEIVKNVNKVIHKMACGARDIIKEVGGGAVSVIYEIVSGMVDPLAKNPLISGSVLAGSLALLLTVGTGLLITIHLLK